jgi:peptidoglycan hydrolase-like protein with peptidoglycan-binding domain
MMTRRATPILASAAIALSVTGCGWMGMGGSEQQTSSQTTTTSQATAAPRPAIGGSAGLSTSADPKTPAYQQYPRSAAAMQEGDRPPADYGPNTRRGAGAGQMRTQQQSMSSDWSSERQSTRTESRSMRSDQQATQSRQSAMTGAEGQSRDTVRNIQQELERRGYELGAVDGIYGPRTRQAVTAFQRDENLRADGRIGPQTLAALGMSESGQQVGEVPAATGIEQQQGTGEVERRVETERRIETERSVDPQADIGPREQTGQLPGETGGTDLPQESGTLPDTGSEAPGSAQPSERSGGLQGNEPSVETPMGGTPDTPR